MVKSVATWEVFHMVPRKPLAVGSLHGKFDYFTHDFLLFLVYTQSRKKFIPKRYK